MHITTALDSSRVSVSTMLVAQIVLMEREAPLGALPPRRRFGVVASSVLRHLERALAPHGDARRQHSHHALAGGAPLVEAHADADVAIALALAEAIGRDLAQRAPLQVGQFEILEHDLDQFLERDVGLVIIDAGAVAGLAVALALAVLAGLADDLAGLRVAVALADAGRIVAVDEAVFLDPAQRNLDDAVLVFADDRFFGDDVGDIFADRFADFLAMAQAIAGRAIGAFGVGEAVFAKDGFAHARLPRPRSAHHRLIIRRAPARCNVMRHGVPHIGADRRYACRS